MTKEQLRSGRRHPSPSSRATIWRSSITTAGFTACRRPSRISEAFFKVTSPVVHQMIKPLHARGFIDREPGKARSITLRLGRAQLPDLETHPGLGKPVLNSGAGMGAKKPRGTSASRREEAGIQSRSGGKGASRSWPHGTRQQSHCLDVLTGEEAGAVLRALLKAHPDLLPDARLAADRLLVQHNRLHVA